MNLISIFPLADTWGMHGDDVGTGWMIVMALMMMLFWAAVILGIVWIARGSLAGWRSDRMDPATGGGRGETPTEILERRFAEGAIPVEEYHQRREVIESQTRRREGTGGG